MIEIDIRARAGDLALNAKLSAPTPTIVSVFGPSGAGKTTLLRCIAGLHAPDSGAIALDGETLFDANANINLKTEARRIGYVFQDARLFPHLSVRDNLLYGYNRAPQRNVHLDDVIDALAIAPLLERSIRALSGGERQRIALGRALLAQPRLILMDEPLAAIDSARKTEILSLIHALRRFATAILHVSHDLDEVAALADHVALMEAGAITHVGEAGAQFLDPRLPLAHRDDARALLDGVIAAHENTITAVTVCAGRLILPRDKRAPGERVRLQVFARDVSIALEPPQSISIRNILPARIAAIHARADAQALVELATDVGPLIALITNDSVSALALAPGRAVHALVKAAAVK